MNPTSRWYLGEDGNTITTLAANTGIGLDFDRAMGALHLAPCGNPFPIALPADSAQTETVRFT